MASLDVSSLLGMLSGDGVSALGKSADAKKKPGFQRVGFRAPLAAYRHEEQRLHKGRRIFFK